MLSDEQLRHFNKLGFVVLRNFFSRDELKILIDEFEVGVAHVSAQRGELVVVFELKAAMGRLTAKELKLPVKAYDPDVHCRKVRDKWFGGSPGGGE